MIPQETQCERLLARFAVFVYSNLVLTQQHLCMKACIWQFGIHSAAESNMGISPGDIG